MNKNDIRSRIKAQKTLLDDQERRAAAEAVFSALEKTAGFILAEHVLLYHSLPDELSTHEFIDKWAGRKHFYLPRVNGVNLEILPYDRSHLKLGTFRIEEPQGDDICDIDTIDLVVVPAVAYDKAGNRVGRGRGYYDRLLHNTRALKVGVGYDFQVVEQIDAEPHDVSVDIVITDKNTYYVK